jgi:hypothetical protein
VIDCESRYYATLNANVHRGIHDLSQRATDAFEAARDKVRGLINAADTKEIVFVRGTTEAINLVAQSYGRSRLKAGDEILVTELEHHSNIVPWQLLCEQTGARLRVAPIDDAGALRLDKFEELINPRTRLVAVAHVSNALGTINPVRRLIELAHAVGAPVLVDGAQAAPHLKVDVRALDCDFYAFSGHKLYGPTGIGVLYGKAALLGAMPPYQGGGDMITALRSKTWYNTLPFVRGGHAEHRRSIGPAARRLRRERPDAIALPNMTSRLRDPPRQRVAGFDRDRYGQGQGRHSVVHARRNPPARDRHDSVPPGHCHPHGPSLRDAGDGAFRRTRDGSRVVRALQHAGRSRRLDRGPARSSGVVLAMSDLRDLYQEVILDHYRKPRNFGPLADADRKAEGFNPLCGDRLTLYVKLMDGVIADASFEGSGCAISTALRRC